jgi:hypothetical protein
MSDDFPQVYPRELIFYILGVVTGFILSVCFAPVFIR